MPRDGIANLVDVRRLLVVLPTWVGDFVMATPTLRAIRLRFPDARTTFLAVPNLRGVIESGPWMDDVIVWPGAAEKSRAVRFLALTRRLRAERFDLAVLLPNSFRSALIARLASVRRRVGYDRDSRGWLLTDRLCVPRTGGRIEPHPICNYYGRIAEALGCAQPGDVLELFTNAACEASVQRRLESLDICNGKPLVIVSPGASYGASKLWLPERFAEVADRLIAEQGAAVLITCGPGEQPIAHRILDAMTQAACVLDEPLLSLAEFKAIIKRSQLLVCNDAGPRHIAKAFGIPVVTIFGPTHQAWTDTAYALERKMAVTVDCGPCQKKVCPFDHHKCMTGVTVDSVYDGCVALLERPLAGTSG